MEGGPKKSEGDTNNMMQVVEKAREADVDELRQLAGQCADSKHFDLMDHLMAKVKRVEFIQYKALNHVLDEGGKG